MAVAMLPSILLTGLGLLRAGYRATNLFAVLALSVLLVPVNMSGTMHSLRQALTGRQIPFARTPKVAGRTSTPKGYLVTIYLFIVYAAVASVIDVYLGNYTHAAFAAFNASIMIYCIIRFIGWRHSLDDMGIAHLIHRRQRIVPDRSNLPAFPGDPIVEPGQLVTNRFLRNPASGS